MKHTKFKFLNTRVGRSDVEFFNTKRLIFQVYCYNSSTLLLSQWSRFSSSDRCDPIPVGRNSGEDLWCSGMAVTPSPAHNTNELVLPILGALQWSSRLSLQPAKREVLLAAWSIVEANPECTGWSDKAQVTLSSLISTHNSTENQNHSGSWQMLQISESYQNLYFQGEAKRYTECKLIQYWQ